MSKPPSSGFDNVDRHYNGSRWDRREFKGRFKYFLAVTDPRKAFVSNKSLEEAKQIVLQSNNFKPPAGVSVEKYWASKHLYESAFHPDSGQKMNIFGRMSFQVPGGMAITGALLHFYKTPAQVVIGQWLNQSFNALVNYTNRNAASSISTTQMAVAYASATSAALMVALGLNRYSQKAPPIVARWVPFVAVASANAVNIPMSRQSELKEGVVVYDENHNPVGKSRKAARKGIFQVVISRITIAAPGMIFVPMIMEKLLKQSSVFSRMTWAHLPFQTAAVGAFLTFMVPVGCSLFPQNCKLSFHALEEDLKQEILKRGGNEIKEVHFNKGL